jgi:hypothetical protein
MSEVTDSLKMVCRIAEPCPDSYLQQRPFAAQTDSVTVTAVSCTESDGVQ